MENHDHSRTDDTRHIEKVELLFENVRIFCEDIEMEFGIEKCAVLRICQRKEKSTERIKLRNNKNLQKVE